MSLEEGMKLFSVLFTDVLLFKQIPTCDKGCKLHIRTHYMHVHMHYTTPYYRLHIHNSIHMPLEACSQTSSGSMLSSVCLIVIFLI